MKKLILTFGVLLFWGGVANAQFEEKVNNKIQQLEILSEQVNQSFMPENHKIWAQEQIDINIEELNASVSESNIERLRFLESTINIINEEIVELLVEAQKNRLLAKIKELDQLIFDYAAQGMDTEKLEMLQMSMLEKLAMID